MPREGIASTNGRNKTYEALVKSLFTNISHAKELDIPPRPQSRIGFRRNRPPKIKSRPQPDSPLLDGEATAGATQTHGADSDEDTADSETSDEWSTDSDTSDTTSPNDLRPCSAVPPSPPPILVPDAFPGQDLPSLAIQTDLPVRSPPPLRPMFPHHGLSRSALQHQKWLWNARYDEWIQWRAEVETAEAEMGPYGGISNPVVIEPPPPLRRPRVSSSAASPTIPPETELPSVGRKAELNEKIFPRTGDITDLHDPQVARLDQTFSNYPLWTIQKVLFVCSMDTAARRRSPLARNSGKDAAAPPSSAKEAEMKTHVAVPHTLPASSSESAMPLLTKLRWEQSWHTRWEVLTALVRMTEQAVLARGPTTIPATVTTPIGLPVVARSLADVDECSNTRGDPGRFFFANSEGLGASDGSESDDDDDEEDDYGEIILNPRFGLSRSMTAERGLGHPFLHAQVPPIDARSRVKARSS